MRTNPEYEALWQVVIQFWLTGRADVEGVMYESLASWLHHMLNYPVKCAPDQIAGAHYRFQQVHTIVGISTTNDDITCCDFSINPLWLVNLFVISGYAYIK